MLDLSTLQVCTRLGLDRAVLYRVEASERLVVESANFAPPADGRDAFMRRMRDEELALHRSAPSAAAVRRGRALLVADPVGALDPVSLDGAAGYVLAPVVAGRRVTGLLYADRRRPGPPPGTPERDLVAAFARGVGYALEVMKLRERLRRQRNDILRLVAVGEAADSADDGAGEHRDARLNGFGSTSDGVLWPSPAPPDLTRREREVHALMVQGATNADIARALVISPGTVKSHVKHILRKLGAANRTEAVALHLNGRRNA